MVQEIFVNIINNDIEDVEIGTIHGLRNHLLKRNARLQHLQCVGSRDTTVQHRGESSGRPSMAKVQDCSISNGIAVEIPQSGTKSSSLISMVKVEDWGISNVLAGEIPQSSTKPTISGFLPPTL